MEAKSKTAKRSSVGSIRAKLGQNAKAGKRKKYCSQYPACPHNAKCRIHQGLLVDSTSDKPTHRSCPDVPVGSKTPMSKAVFNW